MSRSAFVLDRLSKTMLVLVTGVGALIHIYSLGYMRDDEGKSRYFAALSLFMFAMLGIVLANNFVMMFIFWELVGVSFLFAHRPLVRTRRRRRCRQKSVHHQSHRRFRFHARHPDGLDCDRLGRLYRDRVEDVEANGTSGISHCRRALDFLRRGRQVRAISAARLVAGRDGRPDAGLCLDPRRDDGGRRRLHAGARRFSHSTVADCTPRHRLDRNDHRCASPR